MERDPTTSTTSTTTITTSARLSLKRPHDHDEHSSEPPAPKRVKLSLSLSLEPVIGLYPESDDDCQMSPTATSAQSQRKKSTPMSRGALPLPPPNHESNDQSYSMANDDILVGFREEWETGPPGTAPAQHPPKQEWSLIRVNTERPDLNHHSDNPFDFLSAAKLDKLIRFRKNDKEATEKLTIVEREVLGDPRIKKILAKVVCYGTPPMDAERRNAWICSAILSAIAQSGAEVQDFVSSRLAINPGKPGYSWVIIPVKMAIFKTLVDIRGALDPRSGTLILFRPWNDASFPIQHIYAFGIHHVDDFVSCDVATADYAEQIVRRSLRTR